MIKRSIRFPAVLLALALAGGLVLLGLDTHALIENPAVDAPFRSDIRVAFTTIVIAACVWIALVLVLEGQGRLKDGQEGLASAMRGVQARLADLEQQGSVTQPIPRLRAVGTVVATAAVAVAPPSGPLAEVVPMPSPTTVAAMRRLAAKVTETD